MIVVDSSAIVAIALKEAEAVRFIQLMQVDGASQISAANYFEASLVLEGRLGTTGRIAFEKVMSQLIGIGLHIVALNLQTADIAREAFRNFGKGRHPASLNFGDCLAYALAKELGAPLLYKGRDFDKTDIVRA